MAVTVTRTRSARIHHGVQGIHYLYARFNFSDIDQTTTNPGKFYLGVLPANCMPLETYVRVASTFTGANLIVGTSAAGSSAVVVSTDDVTAGTSGAYIVDRYLGTYSSVDVPLYIQTKASGATLGTADVWQAYLPGYPNT